MFLKRSLIIEHIKNIRVYSKTEGEVKAKLVFEPEEGLSGLLLRNAFLNLLTLRLYRF